MTSVSDFDSDHEPPPPRMPRSRPKPPPHCLVWEVALVVDCPLWNSWAVALVTSLSARLWVIVLASCSVSVMLSVTAARVRRDQSIIAIRVVSPGASEVEWRSCPRVRPWANQDWLKLRSAPVAKRWKPAGAASAAWRSIGPTVSIG